MTDDALGVEVRVIKSRLPHAGYQIVNGCPQAEVHRVQWTQVKGSMCRVSLQTLTVGNIITVIGTI